MEQLANTIQNTPIITFTILLLLILTIPPVFERIKIPGIVGLLFAGVIFGSDGLGFLDKDQESIKLLADIGKIYLMFVAGLEIDLNDFRKSKNKALTFGWFTFIIPLVIGALVGRIVGLGWNASILLGSILSSHTLLGYPIVNRLGVVANEAVVITIGATIFTDIGALLVLAICVSIYGGDFTVTSLIFQLVILALYAFIVLYGFDRAGKEYFRRTGDEESNQFLFVLLVVFLASVGAQIINVDQIVGAFLAGLAVNDVVGNSPVKEKIEFVGSTLFIPCFFVSTGLILNLSDFVTNLNENLVLTIMVVSGLILSKFIAALIVRLIYKYSWDQCLTMWSLSLPQVAATLAATLVGVNVGLLPNSVFNAVIVMMLVTSIAGPILTAKFASNLFATETGLDIINELNQEQPISRTFVDDDQILLAPNHSFKVIVPLANHETGSFLVKIASLVAQHESGSVIPLSIVKAHVHMDDPELDLALNRSQKLLNNALKDSQSFVIPIKPIIRIDDDIAEAISRTAKENKANLMIMGWNRTYTIKARLFGNLIDKVFWSSHCPIAVTKLLDDPSEIQKILVPVKNLDLKSLHIIRFSSILADSNQATLTLFHVYDLHLSKKQIKLFSTRLEVAMTEIAPHINFDIKKIRHYDPTEAILHIAEKYNYDLVVLRSVRRRTAGGLAMSDVTSQVMQKLERSFIIFGEPH
jgi:Kef-type K+ transport system membrane component KefB/nucleotide-binding universal stress UspA family protein